MSSSRNFVSPISENTVSAMERSFGVPAIQFEIAWLSLGLIGFSGSNLTSEAFHWSNAHDAINIAF